MSCYDVNQKQDIADKGAFNAIARKLTVMRHVPCCGMCGQTRYSSIALALG